MPISFLCALGKVLAVVCFVFASCTSTPEQALVGKWKLTSGADTIEFFADGLVISVEQGGTTQGSYHFLDATQVQIAPGVWGVAGSVVLQVWIAGDELILTLPQVGSKKYRRVREER
jgi:hypothetical protein